MFVDQAIITLKAGDGGAGHSSFRRQKYEAKGGPDGGDGGRGGDVILVADEGLNTLLDFQGRPEWAASHGDPGSKKQQHGRDGMHLIVRVPAGTLVYNNDTGELLADIGKPGTEAGQYVAVRGGFGGFGNEHYKSSTNQTPTYAHPGQKGEEITVRLELKLLADVGLLGLPNAGKSTLLAALTRATPKIGDYPFTTLTPQLGVAELDPARRLVIADIPGLIEGAADGKGLGIDFLKHIERTKVLVHLLDCAPVDGADPAVSYRTIRKELRRYSRVLAERREIIVLNKVDLLENDEARQAAVAKLRTKLKLQPHVQVIPISGAINHGTRELLKVIWQAVQEVGSGWDQPIDRAAKPAAKSTKKPAKRAAKPVKATKKSAQKTTQTTAKTTAKKIAKKTPRAAAKKSPAKTTKKAKPASKSAKKPTKRR